MPEYIIVTVDSMKTTFHYDSGLPTLAEFSRWIEDCQNEGAEWVESARITEEWVMNREILEVSMVEPGPKSFTTDPQFTGLTPGEQLEVLVSLVENIESNLAENAKGNQSAADVMGELWGMGLDPNDHTAYEP